MAGQGTDNKSLLRAKLEFPVWYRSFTKSYTAWSNAPSDLKTPLLLSGASLAKAEVWLLACPEKLTDSQKRYIVRSISQKAREPSAGPNAPLSARSRSKSRWYRTSDRSLWHLYAVIAVGIYVFAPEFISDSMERALNPPDALQEIKRQRQLANSKSPPQPSARPSVQPSDDPDAEPVSDVAMANPQAPTEHAMEPVEEQPAPIVTPASAPEPPPLSRSDRLAALATERLSAGNHRQGILLAIEAAELGREAASAAPSAGPLLSTSHPLIAALASRTVLAPLVTATEISRTAHFCADDVTLLTPTASREATLWADGGRRTSAIAGLERGLDGTATNRDCSRIAVPNADFDVELRPLSGDGRTIVLSGHEAGIVNIAFSRDGTAAATASQDSSARVWDARTGRQRAILTGHDWHVLAAEFSPDNRRVLTASADNTARVWEASTGRQLLVLSGHQGRVTSARYSQDGRRILTVSWDGSIRLFDAATGSRLVTLRNPQGNYDAAALSSDGTRVATIDAAGHTSLWHIAGQEAPVEVAKIAGTARQVSFSPDGRFLAVLDWTGTIRLHASETGAPALTVGAASDPLRAMSFSNGAPGIIAVSRSGTRYSWPIVTSIESALALAKGSAPPCLSADERLLLGLDGEAPAWCAEIRPRGATLPQ